VKSLKQRHLLKSYQVRHNRCDNRATELSYVTVDEYAVTTTADLEIGYEV